MNSVVMFISADLLGWWWMDVDGAGVIYGVLLCTSEKSGKLQRSIDANSGLETQVNKFGEQTTFFNGLFCKACLQVWLYFLKHQRQLLIPPGLRIKTVIESSIGGVHNCWLSHNVSCELSRNTYSTRTTVTCSDSVWHGIPY